MPTSESETPQPNERRGCFRVPLSTRSSRWEFRLRRGFFDAIALDLAEGGMFVSTSEPQLKGSEIDFEVRLGDQEETISGKAEVAWVCPRSSKGGHPVGMGLRFIDLEGDGGSVVRNAVEKRFFSRSPLAIHDLWTGGQ